MAKMLVVSFFICVLGTSYGMPDVSSLKDVSNQQKIEHQSKAGVEPVQAVPIQQDPIVSPSNAQQVEVSQPGAETVKQIPVDVGVSPDADPSTDGSRSDLETDSTLWGGWGGGWNNGWGYRSYKPYWNPGWSNYGYYNPWRRYSGGYWSGRGYGGGWGWGGNRGGYYW